MWLELEQCIFNGWALQFSTKEMTTVMATFALCVGAAMFAGAVTSLIPGVPSGSLRIVAMLWVVSGSIWVACGLILTALEKLRRNGRPISSTMDNKDQ